MAPFSRRSFSEGAVHWCSIAPLRLHVVRFSSLSSSCCLVPPCSGVFHCSHLRLTSCAGPAPTSLRASLAPVFWSVLVVMLGCAPDADDLSWETEGCKRSFLLRLRLSMTDDTSPFQFASCSWIPARVSFNCIGHCTTDSFVSRSQSGGPRRVAFQQAFHSSPTCCFCPRPVLK